MKVALVVLRAGKDDKEAVYKAISFQTNHREAFYFVASPKGTLISGRGFRSKISPLVGCVAIVKQMHCYGRL